MEFYFTVDFRQLMDDFGKYHKNFQGNIGVKWFCVVIPYKRVGTIKYHKISKCII
jgi:hypothetical protein